MDDPRPTFGCLRSFSHRPDGKELLDKSRSSRFFEDSSWAAARNGHGSKVFEQVQRLFFFAESHMDERHAEEVESRMTVRWNLEIVKQV